MLLIETEQCENCESYESGEEESMNKCNNKYIRKVIKDGVFNYYYIDIINCNPTCKYFTELSWKNKKLIL